MIINAPCFISSRLLPAIKVGDATISIGYARKRDRDNRTAYRYYIDLKDGEDGYTCDDIKSGVGGGNLQEGLHSVLSFLSACAESYRYAGEDGENSDLFPQFIAEWAMANSDELSMASLELDSSEDNEYSVIAIDES